MFPHPAVAVPASGAPAAAPGLPPPGPSDASTERRRRRTRLAPGRGSPRRAPPAATWDPARAVGEPGARQAGVAIEPGLRGTRRPGRRRQH